MGDDDDDPSRERPRRRGARPDDARLLERDHTHEAVRRRLDVDQQWWTSGLEALAVGALAAGLAFGLGAALQGVA